MEHKYISKYQQFSNDDLKELKNTIIKNHPNNIDNIIEIGTKAGFATLMLSELSKKVITLDEGSFWSPSVKDHLELNHINNVKVRNDKDILSLLKEEIVNKPEVVFIDIEHEQVFESSRDLIKKFQKNNSDYKSVTIVFRTIEGFETEVIDTQKKTIKKKTPTEVSVSG
jgi:16S rRNA A1518/A1519 N6-dimethyltransferase RsmA/KsgA/DIM1 with predicted DNA glycosylase/AP lyase activity